MVAKIAKVLSESEIKRLAKEEGFVIRESKKVTAVGFLKMLLFDQLQFDNPSLQQHALQFAETNGITITGEGLNKRFNETAVAFIKKVLEKYLNHTLSPETIPTDLKDKYTSIRIMDSTEFKLDDSLKEVFPGYSSDSAMACASIQLEYDIISKRICNLDLSSANQSDKTYGDDHMSSVNEGDLIIRDLGYYSLQSYSMLEARKAFYISRLKSQIKIYQKVDEEYVELDLEKLIKQIKKSKQVFFDEPVYIGAKVKKEVRLMAWLLKEDAQKNRLAKKKNKKGKTNNKDILWSMLNVFITNIPRKELMPQDAYQLYTIRWQIELMFKTWKSILKLDVVRKMKADRIKCYLYTKLLWILLCWDITAICETVVWSQQERLISLYKCFSILKNCAAGIRKTFMVNSENLKEWLLKMLEYSGIYGLKDDKKGRKKVKDILRYK